MVQKKGKYGIRTGNTIRAVNTKYVRRYRKDAVIFRRDLQWTSHVIDRNGVISDVIEGADIPCTDIFYSLNKNRRWLLPDLIKEIQTDEEFGDVNFELVERHKLLKNTNCFSIYTSYIVSKDDDFIRDNKIIIPKNVYLDADNVLNSQSVQSRHYRRLLYLNVFSRLYHEEFKSDIDENEKEIKKECDKTKGQNNICEEQQEVEEEIPTVRYEVLYPCVPTNVITQKPKQICNDIGKSFKCRNYLRKPWTSRKYEFRSRLAKDKRNYINYEIEEALGDYDAERYTFQKHAKYNVPKKEFRPPDVTKDLEKVKIANNPKRKFKNVDSANENTKHQETNSNEENKSPISLSTSNEEINIAKCEERSYDEEEGEEPVFFPRKISGRPVCVVLRQEEINVDALHNEYGDDVLECKSSPRRFILNISKYIQDLDLEGIGSAYKLLRIMNKTMFSWLVFVHDPMNKRNSVNEKAFHVSLNANFNSNVTHVEIEGLTEGTTVSISIIIDSTINFLKRLPRESMIFETKPSKNRYRPIVTSNSLLENMKQWTCWTYIPDNFYILKHLLESESSAEKVSEEKLITQEKHEQTKTKLCSICFRYTYVKLALLPCFHSFCNACWDAYIHEKYELGCTLIFCPEVDCTIHVDLGTIMSFLNVKEILTFARQFHNISVEKNRLAKWCTNEACGRVIIVNTIRSKSLRCICGELICFSCSGIPHWPLQCRKYFDYVKILLETRDKNISPHEFVIKFDLIYCRICFNVVKHYDRCMTTDCPCGSVLCFRCSSLWHNKSMSICQLRENTTASMKSCESYTGLTSQGNFFSVNKRTRWYKLAMKHRLHQHPYRLAKLQASSKLLANRISHYILKEERKGSYVKLDYAGDEASSHVREPERAANYMAYIVEMYKETSNIIENTSFFLNDESSGERETKELVHRRTMILSTCAKTILDIIKDGAFLNPKVVIGRLNEACGEIRRVLRCIVKDI